MRKLNTIKATLDLGTALHTREDGCAFWALQLPATRRRLLASPWNIWSLLLPLALRGTSSTALFNSQVVTRQVENIVRMFLKPSVRLGLLPLDLFYSNFYPYSCRCAHLVWLATHIWSSRRVFFVCFLTCGVTGIVGHWTVWVSHCVGCLGGTKQSQLALP